MDRGVSLKREVQKCKVGDDATSQSCHERMLGLNTVKSTAIDRHSTPVLLVKTLQFEHFSAIRLHNVYTYIYFEAANFFYIF